MLENLEALVAVIEAQSITKASARLHITQSAVSRRLQQLEDALGMPLFDRAQRPPSPTAMGLRVYEQSLPILRSVEDLVAMTKEQADPAGVLRLGMAQGVADLLLDPAAASLEAFPKLGLRLRTDWSGGLTDHVVDGTLDAALVLLPLGALPPASLTGRFIGSLQTVIVQQARNPRFRRPMRLLHLAKEDWVLNPIGCGYRSALETALGERNGTLHVAIDTYGTDIQLRMVALGRGLGLVPRAALFSSRARDEVSIVDVTDFSLSLSVWLVHRPQPGNLRKTFDAIALGVASVMDGAAA
jgi:DNA-binding transcriptional LysR family regulator